MKLRLGGIQTLAANAKRREELANNAHNFCVHSMTFNQRYEDEMNWTLPAWGRRQPIIQRINVQIPFTYATCERIYNLMNMQQKVDMTIYHLNEIESPYCFKGASISQLEPCQFNRDGSITVNVTIMFDSCFRAIHE